MARRRGFTLVELLVVIGIIAILIATLLPTLAGARRSAAAVKCAAHLRDLGSAIQMYANENQQYLPTVQSSYKAGANTTIVMWYDQLARYVFKSGVATVGAPGTSTSVINDINFGRTPFVGCPAFEFSRAGNPQRTSTGYGLTLTPVPLADPVVLNQFPSLSSDAPARYFRFNELKNPANRALMADANGYGGIRARDPDPINAYTRPNGNNAQGDIDYYRHGRLFDLSRPGCNVMFADLHVETCTPWAAFWSIRNPARKANGAR